MATLQIVGLGGSDWHWGWGLLCQQTNMGKECGLFSTSFQPGSPTWVCPEPGPVCEHWSWLSNLWYCPRSRIIAYLRSTKLSFFCIPPHWWLQLIKQNASFAEFRESTECGLHVPDGRTEIHRTTICKLRFRLPRVLWCSERDDFEEGAPRSSSAD